MVFELILKLSFCFSKITSLTTHFTFENVYYFFRVTVYRITLNFKVSLQASVLRFVSVVIELQTYQVFFSHDSHIMVLLVLVRTILTRNSLRLLSLQNPTTVTLGNSFLCSLSRANNEWYSCNMFLTFWKTSWQVILNVSFGSEIFVFSLSEWSFLEFCRGLYFLIILPLYPLSINHPSK